MVAAFVAALRLPGIAEEIAPLVADLPAPVARDVLAALRAGVSAGPGSVGAVFARAARLIDNAWTAAWKQIGTASPSPLPQLLGERDAAFVTAVCEQVAAAGGEIVLPPVPALPSWLDDEVLERSAAFGWLRAAIGDTDGVLLHDPGCRVIRSRPLSQVDHVPLWRVLIERPDRLCSVCGGPALRDLVPLAGFVAAVDVWHVRGCGPVERWQQVALQRLVAASAEARARLAEPEVTLAARIVGALAADAPGEEGRAAYSLAVPILDWLVELNPAQREEARVLTRDRLAVLEQQLPADQRALSLPADADADTVRDRYRQLTSRFAGIPQLDRLLFGLPDRADRAPAGAHHSSSACHFRWPLRLGPMSLDGPRNDVRPARAVWRYQHVPPSSGLLATLPGVIEFARRSSRTFRSSSTSRAASAVVVPGRPLASISAWVSQPRSVSGLIPSCSPIRRHAQNVPPGPDGLPTSSGSSVRVAPPGTSAVPPSLFLQA